MNTQSVSSEFLDMRCNRPNRSSDSTSDSTRLGRVGVDADAVGSCHSADVLGLALFRSVTRIQATVGNSAWVINFLNVASGPLDQAAVLGVQDKESVDDDPLTRENTRALKISDPLRAQAPEIVVKAPGPIPCANLHRGIATCRLVVPGDIGSSTFVPVPLTTRLRKRLTCVRSI
ncbi:MAG: hypothetical protein CM1200mP29_14220 [Verrucomicrobiota bacterium]|nr:MAG: hypothetical protein CM1200mP29_14220 [Verrucomicrobiota bacterium]